MSAQVDLINSYWMFNPDHDTYYFQASEFIKFNDANEIEHFDGQGKFVRRDTITIDENKNYTILASPTDKRIEFLNSNEINFMFEVKHSVNDEDLGTKTIKLNFTRIGKTQLEISDQELEEITTHSQWKLANGNREDSKIIELSKWQLLDKEEKEEILKDRMVYRKLKPSLHLVKVSEAFFYIQQKLDRISSKAFVSKLTEGELVIEAENDEWTLERVKD